jgi:hypothetical protein
MSSESWAMEQLFLCAIVFYAVKNVAAFIVSETFLFY